MPFIYLFILNQVIVPWQVHLWRNSTDIHDTFMSCNQQALDLNSSDQLDESTLTPRFVSELVYNEIQTFFSILVRVII